MVATITCNQSGVVASLNGYHVEVRGRVSGVVLFKRGYDSGKEWQDDAHKRITNAMDELERALSAVV